MMKAVTSPSSTLLTTSDCNTSICRVCSSTMDLKKNVRLSLVFDIHFTYDNGEFVITAEILPTSDCNASICRVCSFTMALKKNVRLSLGFDIHFTYDNGEFVIIAEILPTSDCNASICRVCSSTIDLKENIRLINNSIAFTMKFLVAHMLGHKVRLKFSFAPKSI